MAVVMIKILVVDDNKKYLEGLIRMLNDDPDIQVTGEAFNGRDAIKMVIEKQYDVITMDVSLPDLGGIEVLKRIRNSGIKIPVLMLSIFPASIYASQAFKAGASGYLIKNKAPWELINAIKSVVKM